MSAASECFVRYSLAADEDVSRPATPTADEDVGRRLLAANEEAADEGVGQRSLTADEKAADDGLILLVLASALRSRSVLLPIARR